MVFVLQFFIWLFSYFFPCADECWKQCSVGDYMWWYLVPDFNDMWHMKRCRWTLPFRNTLTKQLELGCSCIDAICNGARVGCTSRREGVSVFLVCSLCSILITFPVFFSNILDLPKNYQHGDGICMICSCILCCFLCFLISFPGILDVLESIELWTSENNIFVIYIHFSWINSSHRKHK